MAAKDRSGIGEEALRSNLAWWLENPSWAEYYDEAPTERCRRFIALEFYYSMYEDKTAAREMDRIEAEMDAEELRYLLENCGHNPRRKALRDRIRELEAVDRKEDSSHT